MNTMYAQFLAVFVVICHIVLKARATDPLILQFGVNPRILERGAVHMLHNVAIVAVVKGVVLILQFTVALFTKNVPAVAPGVVLHSQKGNLVERHTSKDMGWG